MKRLVVILWLTIISQVLPANVSFKTGLNYPWLEHIEEESSLLPVLGLGLEFPLLKENRLSLGIDALFAIEKMALNGITYESSSFGPNPGDPIYKTDYTFTYNYLKVDLFAQLRLCKIKDYMLFFKGGPILNICLKEHYSYSNKRFLGRVIDGLDFDYNTISELNDSSYLAFFGGISIKKGSVGFDVLYSKSSIESYGIGYLSIRDYFYTIQFVLSKLVK